MPELRRDPLSGRWVIIAGERGARPSDFPHNEIPKGADTSCPFCAGAEAMTPPEVYAIRDGDSAPDSPGWQVRVVPNKFPALKMEPSGTGVAAGRLFEYGSARGFHEVVIHHPDHDLSLGELSDEQVADVLRTYALRFREFARVEGISHVIAIINYGKESGASLAHPHSQLLALPMVPEFIEREMLRSRAALTESGKCLMCSVLKEEAADGSRVVMREDDFLLLAPYASRAPFELLLAPLTHGSNFEEVSAGVIAGVASGLRLSLDLINRVLHDPPYNVVLHSGPLREKDDAFHWHIEIIPRVTTLAGFEAGSGVFINTLPPERAAEILRSSTEA